MKEFLTLFMFAQFILSCKKQTIDYLNKNDFVHIKKELVQDTIVPQSFLNKYHNKRIFKVVLKSDVSLKNDIIRGLKNKTNVVYNEKNLDKNLTVCQFEIEEEIIYNYFFRNDKMIYKLIIPVNKAHFDIQYKDWNNDSKSDLLTIYEQWEGGGGANYHSKTLSIYEIQKDTLLEIASMPIKTVICELDEKSSIQEYQYYFDRNTNTLKGEKIIGKGNCDTDNIKTVDSVKSRNFILNEYNNKINF